jgi:hypothetical protein
LTIYIIKSIGCRMKIVNKDHSGFFSGVSGFLSRTFHSTAIRRHARLLTLLTVAVLGLVPGRAFASWHYWDVFPLTSVTSIASAPNGGFWVQIANFNSLGWEGWTESRSGAPRIDNVAGRGTIASIPGRNGYWVVKPGGDIIPRGDAPVLCGGTLSNCGFPELPLDTENIIVAAAATPTGRGLWALGLDGRVWPAGDAGSYGEVTNDSKRPTGIVATPSGKGYYVVLEDGGVYSFGDAVFYGSTGGKPPAGRQITGMALSIDNAGEVNGYWLVGEDGGVHTFGNAPFLGSSGGDNGGNGVTGIVSFPVPVPGQAPQRTQGYAWVFEHGQVAVVRDPSWPPSVPKN